MRSRYTLLRSRHQISPPVDVRQTLAFFSSSTRLYPRSVGHGKLPDKLHTQQLSSSASAPSEDDSSTLDVAVEGKTKRRATRGAAKAPDKNDIEVTASGVPRNNLHEILWQPNTPPPSAPFPSDENPYDSGLPEPWLLQDVYETLLLALHPQTQHRATYSSSTSLAIEPTLGFYCPIEGGDYVIDSTVRSLARRANADVVVLDALELSAGEHGIYGKSASIFQFPDNPLQIASQRTSLASRPARSIASRDDHDDDDDASPSFLIGAPTAFTIQIPGSGPGAPVARSSRNGATSLISPMSRGTPIPMQRARAFFEDLLNLSNPSTMEKDGDFLRRPRIVYVRNYHHIAEHVSFWFPSLQAAVRSRRQGPMARPTSPVTGPTVIILGSTPPLSESPQPPSNSRAPGRILGLLAAAGRIPPPSKAPTQEQTWTEKDRISRERRLRERLRRWQKGPEGLLEDMPPFVAMTSFANGQTAGRRAPALPEISLGGNVIAIPFGRPVSEGSGSDAPATPTEGYFRVAGLVPRLRNEQLERHGRMAKRLKINELALKLAVTEAGGLLLGHPEASFRDTASVVEAPPTAVADDQGQAPSGSRSIEAAEQAISRSLSFVNSCLLTLKSWRELKVVADAAVGAVLSASASERGLQALDSSIEPTTVTWDQVSRSVESNAESNSLKNAWIEGSSSTGGGVDDTIPTGAEDEPVTALEVDEVFEAVRKDPELDAHEQRLLGCIVHRATMPTSFKSVHLPPSTIDAVRTMVSLPLLFPHAFSSGILKTHAMEGALLFGPPGTGKTLLARAIARESGARMMIVKPSDVMDMYVGEGEKLVRSVFSLARRLSPTVVFIDEIDSLFGARVSNRESGGTMAHRGIITEFMQEMDGLKSSRDQSVIVMGATNRPFDLDDAVLRRLPRRILIDLPGPKEREEILKIHLRDERLGEDVDLTALGVKTEYFSGSDLKHLCIAAALDAVKESVDVPWIVPTKTVERHGSDSNPNSLSPTSLRDTPMDKSLPTGPTKTPDPDVTPVRTLRGRHFVKALQEITPSSSESLGTLGSLRKWNEEFGEGATSEGRKRRGWGDKFGFGRPNESGQGSNVGIIQPATPLPIERPNSPASTMNF